MGNRVESWKLAQMSWQRLKSTIGSQQLSVGSQQEKQVCSRQSAVFSKNKLAVFGMQLSVV